MAWRLIRIPCSHVYKADAPRKRWLHLTAVMSVFFHGILSVRFVAAQQEGGPQQAAAVDSDQARGGVRPMRAQAVNDVCIVAHLA